jgi:5,10-methylenetetrahydromethanopterin reductase
MTIELSCGLPPGPAFSEQAVLAEDLGYSRIWIFDSAPLWEDPFVHLALAAQRTSRNRSGNRGIDPQRAFGDGDGLIDCGDRPAL